MSISPFFFLWPYTYFVLIYCQRTQLQPLPLEDEDVARERERVEQIDDESTDELRLLRLTKVRQFPS
jgi:hypothetical protein